MVLKAVGPGIAFGGWSRCTAAGKSGTIDSLSYDTSMLLAGNVVLQGCGEAQPAAVSAEPAGSGVVVQWGRVDIAGKITELEFIFLGAKAMYWS